MQIREPVLISNNPACQTLAEGTLSCLYKETWNYREVLEAARDKILLGYHLLSHPLAGSLKPNQTPYRSVLLAKESVSGPDCAQSLLMIETALQAYEKFQNQRATPNWSACIQRDFATLDVSFMQATLARAGIKTTGTR